MRGRAVSYDKANINAYYHVPNIAEDDVFTEYIRKDIDLEEVIQALSRPRAEWKSKEHEALSFLNKKLSRYNKA